MFNDIDFIRAEMSYRRATIARNFRDANPIRPDPVAEPAPAPSPAGQSTPQPARQPQPAPTTIPQAVVQEQPAA